MTAPAFCFDQLLHRSERIVLRRVLLDQLTPTRPDPAPVAHQNHLPEQIQLDDEAVEAQMPPTAFLGALPRFRQRRNRRSGIRVATRF